MKVNLRKKLNSNTSIPPNIGLQDKIFVFLFLILGFFCFYKLGKMTFNSDAHFWYQRSLNFVRALKKGNLLETYQNPKPGVTVMWFSGISMEIFLILYNKFFNFRPLLYTYETFHFYHFSSRAPIVILNLFFLIIYYKLLKDLFNKRVALLSFVFLGFQPFFISNTRIFHADSTLSVFMCLSSLFAIKYFLEKKYKLLILSAIFAGLAILTKLSGIFLIPYFLLLNIFYASKNKTKLVKILKTVILWLMVLIITFIVLFPAMWVSPLPIIKKLYTEIFFLTKTGRDGINPYYYYLTTLPQYITKFSLILFVVGIITLVKRIKKIEYKNLFKILSILSFILFFFSQMSLTSQKMPRYILPVFPFIAIVGALGSNYYIDNIKNKLKRNLALFSLIIVSMLPTLYFFPHYSFYFNESGKDSFDCSLCGNVGKYINSLEKDNNFNVVINTRNPQRFRPFIKGRYLSYKESHLVENYKYLVSDKKQLNKEQKLFCTQIKQFDFRKNTYWYVFKCHQ